MTALLLFALLAADPEWDGEMDSRVVSSGPLFTSGHTSPGPSTCGYAYRFYVEADAGMVALAGAGWKALPVEQGTAPTVQATPFYPIPGGDPVYARNAVTDANAAYVLAGHAADAGLAAVIAGDHTVTCRYFTGSQSKVVFSHGLHQTDGLFLQNTTTGSDAVWAKADGGFVQPIVSTISPVLQWIVHSAVRTATAVTSRANGTAVTTTVANVTVAPTTRNLYLGRYNSTSYAINGMHAGCTIYPCALTDAELTRIEAQWFGGVAESRNVPDVRASTAWNLRTDGVVAAYGNNAPRVDERGLLSYAGESNLLANTTAIDAWTDVGTPTMSANSLVAPDGATTGDLLGDDGAAAYEGKSQNSVTATLGHYTLSCWMQAGTVTIGRLVLNGTGNAAGDLACAFTGLDATWQRKTCATTTPYAAGLLGITSLVEVGDVTTTVGNIGVWGCELQTGSIAGPPIVCDAAACATVTDIHTISTVGWPTKEGEIEISYAPWSATVGGTAELIETRSSTSPYEGVVVYRSAANALRFVVSDSSGAGADTSSAVLTWTPLQHYRVKLRWGGGNVFLYRDGALIASIANGTAKRPAAHRANAVLGADFGDGSSANGYIKLLTVGLPR
mgnify:CR=1 FL=1